MVLGQTLARIIRHSLVAVVLALLIGIAAQAQGPTVRVLAVTHVQAVLEYTAPDGDACEVRVSETNDWEVYVPVNDVAGQSGTIFDSQNAHLDTSRDSTVCDDGTCGDDAETRTVVIGRVGMDVRPGMTNWWLADDSKYYSRALQADTTHYFKVDCGGSDVATGSFTTQTIPFGWTWRDPLPLRAAGTHNWPSTSNIRNSGWIDADFGTKTIRMTLDAEHEGAGWANIFGGSGAQCSHAVVPTYGGYHCYLPVGGGGSPRWYWVNPATEEIKHLGYLTLGYNEDPVDGWGPGGPIFPVHANRTLPIDHTNANVYWWPVTQRGGENGILRATYTGANQAVAAGVAASFSISNRTPQSVESLDDQIVAFDARYVPGLWNLGSPGMSGKYLIMFGMRYGAADELGWVIAWDTETEDVAAAIPLWATAGTRWCIVHGQGASGSAPVVLVGPKNTSSAAQSGPWATALDDADGVDSDDTAFVVDGEPVCTDGTPANCYGESANDDTTLLDAAEGDYFQIGSEYVRITTKTSPTSWVVARAQLGTSAASHANNDALTPICQAARSIESWATVYWNVATDPTGEDLDGGYCLDQKISGSHECSGGSNTVLARVGGEYSFKTGLLPTACAATTTNAIDGGPMFAGADAPASGQTIEEHPSCDTIGVAAGDRGRFFTDVVPFLGSNLMSADPGVVGGAPLGGTSYIYKYINSSYDEAIMAPRLRPLMGVSHNYPLLIVNAPGSALADTSDDHYKVCYAERANECWSGSSPGDVYVNLPELDIDHCGSGAESQPTVPDLCVGTMSTRAQSVPGVSVDVDGMTATGTVNGVTSYGWGRSRILHGLRAGYRGTSTAATNRMVSDASFTLTVMPSDTTPAVMLTKVPRIPTLQTEAYDDFSNYTLVAPDVSGTYPTVHNAVVRWGYLDYGSPTQFYCTQRQEACYQGNGTWDANGDAGADYAGRGGGTNGVNVTGVSCAAGCSIVVPVIPGKMAYAQIVYRNSSNTILGTQPVIVLPGFSQIEGL